MKAQDIDTIERQLNMVEQWRASGMAAHAWAKAHGVEPSKLTGWIGHERTWRERLEGKAPTPRAKPMGQTTASAADKTAAHDFAPVRLRTQPIPTSLHTIRIEHPPSGLVLHWPLSHSTQLAHLLGLPLGSALTSGSAPAST